MKKLMALCAVMVLALGLSFESAAQFSQMAIEDYGIQSIAPVSFSSVRGSVWAEVDNAKEGFRVTDVKATVYKEGSPYVTGEAADVYVSPGRQKVVVSGEASLCPGVSLWSVLQVLFFDPEDYSVDLSLTVTYDSGATRTVVKNRLPVKALLKLK